MSVFAEKDSRSAGVRGFEKRCSSDRLRLQGELKRSDALVGQPSADLATRLASKLATVVPASETYPLWLYVAAPVGLFVGAWLTAGVWVAVTDPPKGATIDAPAVLSGNTVAARSAHPAPAEADETRDKLNSVHLTPPAKLGDGIVDAPAPQTVATVPAAPLVETLQKLVPAAPPAASPASSSDAASIAAVDPPPARTIAPEPLAKASAREANCLVKVAGRVLFQRACPVDSGAVTRKVLDLGGGSSAVVQLDHGQTWTATLDGRSLGKVYRDGGSCWGRKKEIYICAYGV